MTPPELSITNRQRKIPVDLPRLRRLAAFALPICLADPGPDEAPLLADLPVVDVSILSSREMSRVHREFLQISGPTDVITFPYGEILVCAEVAVAQAPAHGLDPDDELALYVIHGLLHLNGYDDIQPEAAQRMRFRQANILNTARKQL